MKTGNHENIERFISMHTIENQVFDMTGEYFSLHGYDLDRYDRRFAMIDVNSSNVRFSANPEFSEELRRRCDLLRSQNFVFIKATPWESINNIEQCEATPWQSFSNLQDCKADGEMHPNIDIEHIKWSGGVSWFWFYMYNKHKDNQYKFDHQEKKFDFLYLNKLPRHHRARMFRKVRPLLDNSLYTNWEINIKLPSEYELPWAQVYPAIGMDQDIYERPYNDTKYSLVSETNDTNDEVFMTEKIWKPIIAQHPFVVHGNYLYLQKLREMGFKTFSSYFDEGYDLEKDQIQRVNKIVKTCREMLKINWKDLYLQTQSLRQHNYDTFFNQKKLSLEINKTLDLFLEFADRS